MRTGPGPYALGPASFGGQGGTLEEETARLSYYGSDYEDELTE
jgi:hypothetical protein